MAPAWAGDRAAGSAVSLSTRRWRPARGCWTRSRRTARPGWRPGWPAFPRPRRPRPARLPSGWWPGSARRTPCRW